MAMSSRKIAETAVPMTPMLLARLPLFTFSRTTLMERASPKESTTTIVEWPAKRRPDSYRSFAVLHQLARDVVDGGDVIGVPTAWRSPNVMPLPPRPG